MNPPASRPALREGRVQAWLLLAIFFLSGFAALVYQMVWQRLLTFFGGADVYSVTLIVSAFMAGLGAGSLAGGHLADRLTLRGRLYAFALAELAVAAFAVVSVPLFYDGLYQGLGERPLPGVLLALLLFAALLWPTFLMGLSLPLLARTFAPDDRRPEDWIARLYGLNTLGAALGAVVTVWGLVRVYGFERCVDVGALLNLACGLLALALARLAPRDGAAPAQDRGAARAPIRTATFTLPVWLLVYTLAGYVALSLEIVWFRLLGVILKSNSFTFATLLALYLVGVGAGALVGARWARDARRPALTFLLLQAGVPAYAVLALALFVHGVGVWPGTHELSAHLASHEGLDMARELRILRRFVAAFGQLAPHALDTLGAFLRLYVLVPLFLIGPATLAMGLSFAFLQRAAQTDPAVVGRRVGALQTANILGSTLGAALTGVWLLDRLGSVWTLRLLVVLGGVFLWLAAGLVTAGARRRTARALALGAATGLALVCPAPATLWAALHGGDPDDVVVAEDAGGLVLLRSVEHEGRPRTALMTNGITQGLLPYGSYHTLLGAFPVLLHPRPESVAIVGLGSSDTLFGSGARPETRRIDSIEIVGAQYRTLQLLARRHPYPGLAMPLTDERVRHVFTDGRAFLMRTSERYDVIEADALLPNAAFAGSLYSREWFDLVRRRLKPGGYGVSWSPTPRTRDTFVAVFPHVLHIADVLVGSDAPLALDRETLRARLRQPLIRAYFRRAGVDAERLFHGFLERPERIFGPRFDRSALTDLNLDLFPRDEYMVPRAAHAAGP